jgi:chemotaxis protein MotB
MSKKGGEEGGGGHGAKWIVTYSDMITLLMTLFIVIVTFGSKEQDRHSKKLDALVGGMGGTGAAGPTGQGIGRDSIMVRMSPLSRMVYSGSETPPVYSDPTSQPTGVALKALKEQPIGQLSDNFAFRVPLDFLFDSSGKLSTSGETFLRSVAAAVRKLPFGVQVRVADRTRAAAAAKVVEYLFATASIYPGRLGVAVCPPGDGVNPNEVLLVLLRNR